MKCLLQHFVVMALVLLIIVASGCNGSSTSTQSLNNTPTHDDFVDSQQLLDKIARAERDSQNTQAPEPIIDLVTPPGWSRSERRPLPTDDHGFTIAYEHESGLAVTLYQYTRGLTYIPNDVNTSLIKGEFNRARNGIEQAVQLGLWQSAKEKTHETVTLGNSQQQALWSQYELAVNGVTVVSDIYVWVHSNFFLKLRCTSRSKEINSNQAVLKPLLSSLGSASVNE
jgi:hypothetical protein